ncbi:hypothetical protein C8R46DRAFT_381609 [Mycena filopes]|nr:hypothetical protein C8R46DRAFT_381609 [Mycena filopes]
MDSDTQPLLADHDDVEANLVHEHDSKAGPSHQHEHLCTRCSAELNSNRTPSKWTPRHILLLVAIFLSCLIFSLFVAQMAVNERAGVHRVFVVIWTDVTATLLILLLYFGGRRHSHRKLNRTAVQIRVLCVLGLSWLALMAGIISDNVDRRACGWSDSCGLFTAAHVFSWLLIVVLFSAAYATYRRAVTIHGSALVPIPRAPPMAPAWRLSSIADSEGSIKI